MSFDINLSTIKLLAFYKYLIDSSSRPSRHFIKFNSGPNDRKLLVELLDELTKFPVKDIRFQPAHGGVICYDEIKQFLIAGKQDRLYINAYNICSELNDIIVDSINEITIVSPEYINVESFKSICNRVNKVTIANNNPGILQPILDCINATKLKQFSHLLGDRNPDNITSMTKFIKTNTNITNLSIIGPYNHNESNDSMITAIAESETLECVTLDLNATSQMYFDLIATTRTIKHLYINDPTPTGDFHKRVNDALRSNFTMLSVSVDHGSIRCDNITRNYSLVWKHARRFVLDYAVIVAPLTEQYNIDTYLLATIFTYTGDHYNHINWYRLHHLIERVVSAYRIVKKSKYLE